MMIRIITFIFCFSILPNLVDAQCYIHRHNTSWNDAWTSCETSENPNIERGDSHWILYNFGNEYSLLNSYVWNLNDPKNLNSGLNEIIIDYSSDGVVWSEWGSFTMNTATGKSRYEGEEGPGFNGLIAQYILITATSNHGGDCYGLSEIKFEIDEDYVSAIHETEQDNYCYNVSISPNPTIGDAYLDIQSNCNEKIYFSITDAMGRTVQEESQLTQQNQSVTLNTAELPAGMYFVKTRIGQKSSSHKLIKMKL